VKRRQVLAGIGGVIALPVTAGAQKSELPVIGYLTSATALSDALAAWRRGLNEMGYIENQMSRLSSVTAGGTTGCCQQWRPISFVEALPLLWQAPRRLRERQARRRQRSRSFSRLATAIR